MRRLLQNPSVQHVLEAENFLQVDIYMLIVNNRNQNQIKTKPADHKCFVKFVPSKYLWKNFSQSKLEGVKNYVSYYYY